MARIPKRELERVKQELPLSTLLQPRMQLKPRGKDLVGCCPFHDDKEASLVVTESKGLWHCFGCDAGGTAIDWVMRTEDLSFREATEKLLAQLNPKEPPTVAFNFEAKMSDAEVMDAVTSTYHAQLLKSPEALAYATEERGISLDVIKEQRIGLAVRSPSLLSRVRASDQEQAKERLQRLGLVRETGFEHLVRCLTVPLVDESGNVVSFYGRKAGEGSPKHLYLPGLRRGFLRASFTNKDDDNDDSVILCEALLDALTFMTHGFRNVVSSFGCEGFTDELLATLKTNGTKRIIIAYDHDAAGDLAADKLAERLKGEGFLCARALFPKNIDANAYAKKMSPADKALAMVLDTARPYDKSKDFFSANINDDSGASTSEVAPVEKEPEAAPLAAEEQAAEEQAVAPKKAVVVEEESPDEVVLKTLGLRFRVRGLSKLNALDVLKVNLLVSTGELFHVDTFDLYAAKARAFFVATAAKEFGIPISEVKRATGRVILALEEVRAQRETNEDEEREPMSDEERESALNLLRSPDLVEQIERDLSKCGLVGEANNKVITYLAATSRKSDRPLAVMVQSSSAAGKSSLMESVLNFIPDEDKVQFSAMTGQSLFYLGAMELKHKVLAIAEEEGAEQASYALKLLQSEGSLRIASTGKDANSGRHTTHTYEVEGPVAILSTTTAFDVDEELLNRCIVLCVDESQAQTAAIHELQRELETLQRLDHKKTKAALIRLHQNAQRLLEPVEVVNPHAAAHVFANKRTRSRRDHMKLLSLIRTIAFLHQHQRRQKRTDDGTLYIEATLDDVKCAEKLLAKLLDNTFDELPPQTRLLFDFIEEFISKEALRREQDPDEPDRVSFSRRQLRQFTGLGDTQLKVHLRRLVELELLVTTRESYHAGLRYRMAPSEESEVFGDVVQPFENAKDSIGRPEPKDKVVRKRIDGQSVGVSVDRSGIGRTPTPTDQAIRNKDELGNNGVSVGLLRSTTTGAPKVVFRSDLNSSVPKSELAPELKSEAKLNGATVEAGT